MDNLFDAIKSVVNSLPTGTVLGGDWSVLARAVEKPRHETGYFWVITQDNNAERFEPQGTNLNAVGQMSPVGPNTGAILLEYQPQPFRLVDDDGRIAYAGIYYGPMDETCFAPLQDFGAPNVGCTEIWFLQIQTHDDAKNGIRNYKAGMAWDMA
jgi:hypothetical protein